MRTGWDTGIPTGNPESLISETGGESSCTPHRVRSVLKRRAQGLKVLPQTPSFIYKENKKIRKGGWRPQQLVAWLLNILEERVKNIWIWI